METTFGRSLLQLIVGEQIECHMDYAVLVEHRALTETDGTKDEQHVGVVPQGHGCQPLDVAPTGDNDESLQKKGCDALMVMIICHREGDFGFLFRFVDDELADSGNSPWIVANTVTCSSTCGSTMLRSSRSGIARLMPKKR